MLLSLLGTILGGILRYIPEIIKLFSAKADAAHELEMTKLQLQIDQARATAAIDIAQVQSAGQEAVAQMQAYTEALKGQSQLTGIKFVDALNSLVRPTVTYWWMFLLTLNKTIEIMVAYQSKLSLGDMSKVIWTDNDWGILSMILGFWFVDRVMKTK